MVTVNDAPIFIGGCERSGTTLLGAMLGGHTDLICTPESQFVLDAVRNLPTWPPTAEAGWEAIRPHWRYKIWDLPPQTPPDLSDYATLLRWLVTQYAAKIGRPAATRWVDHTPSNMRYGHHLLQLFPQAKFIHIVRDGRAVASSVMPLDWGPNTIAYAAPWWVERTAYGLALENKLAETQMMRVHYETLVQQSTETMQAICSFLELDFQPEMLNAAGFQRPTYTTAQHQLIGQGIDPSRLEQWTQQLSPREIELFEALTHDFLRYCGYTPRYGLHARPLTRHEQIGQTIRERGRFLINLFRFHQRRRRIQ